MLGFRSDLIKVEEDDNSRRLRGVPSHVNTRRRTSASSVRSSRVHGTATMAESKFFTKQHASEQFVESCGAVLFTSSEPADAKVCLVNLRSTNEWLLPKGRRNIGESRKEAALREVAEETGFQGRLLPVTMPTRACAPDDHPDVPDKARIQRNITEPFMCTVRELPGGNGTKFIWWYVAVLVDDDHSHRSAGEEQFNTEFFPMDEAVQKLHFETDREVLRRAIQVVTTTEQK
jgi:8-oxo-dGTP pyrophosphatase MutT (NUDIX family)